MSAEAWIFLGGIVTTIGGLVLGYWQFVLPAKKKRDEKTEPVVATDWTREYVTSLLNQIEELGDDNDELQKERDALVSTHADLRVDFERFKAESRAAMDGLRREFEAYRTLADEKVQRLQTEVTRLETENNHLRHELATLRGAS